MALSGSLLPEYRLMCAWESACTRCLRGSICLHVHAHTHAHTGRMLLSRFRQQTLSWRRTGTERTDTPTPSPGSIRAPSHRGRAKPPPCRPDSPRSSAAPERRQHEEKQPEQTGRWRITPVLIISLPEYMFHHSLINHPFITSYSDHHYYSAQCRQHYITVIQ